MLNSREFADLKEIQQLLDEACDNYFAKPDNYSKPMEGHVSVAFSTYFDRREDDRPKDASNVVEVMVYSYALGPSSIHGFESTRDALDAVRAWHKEEMEFDHEAANREMPEPDDE